jgi:epoxyqueuosine reductase QueG
MLDPLSPDVNLPKLATAAGLGNLSPFGLLVHRKFGPRLILTALKTDYPLNFQPRWDNGGCNDCQSCLKICPQEPLDGGVVDLGQCQSCAKCLEVCPTGKGR